MQKEAGPDFFSECETLDKVDTISIPKCKTPQSKPCTIHLTINNLTINSNLQDVNISHKTALSEYMYSLSSNA